MPWQICSDAKQTKCWLLWQHALVHSVQLKWRRWFFRNGTVLFRLSMLHKLRHRLLSGWCFHWPAFASESGLFPWWLWVQSKDLDSGQISINAGHFPICTSIQYWYLDLSVSWPIGACYCINGHMAWPLRWGYHLCAYIFCPSCMLCQDCDDCMHTGALNHLWTMCRYCPAMAAAGSVQQTWPTLEISVAITTLCQTMLQKVLWVMLFDTEMYCLVQM